MLHDCQDPCEEHPCENGGSCTSNDETFNCKCMSGYKGDRCQNDIDECATNNTHNCDENANCTNTPGSYNCTCKLGFKDNGVNCTARGLEHSTILSHYGNASYLQTLTAYLALVLQNQSTSQWKRCWHASEDGWDVMKTFHPQCDNKEPTVTIVRVGQAIYGGYTDKSWRSDGKWYHSDVSFLYSLYNINGFQPKKFELTGEENKYAIGGYKNYGPLFGDGFDLRIYNQASTNKVSYTRPKTYQVPPGCSKSTYCNFFAANVEDRFLVNDVEVFYEFV